MPRALPGRPGDCDCPRLAFATAGSRAAAAAAADHVNTRLAGDAGRLDARRGVGGGGQAEGRRRAGLGWYWYAPQAGDVAIAPGTASISSGRQPLSSSRSR